MVKSSSGGRAHHTRSVVSRLRLRHLQLVESLDRTSSLAKTAAELNMTQSAASKILQDLETIFGSTLFDRRARGLTRTPTGAAVVECAQRSLNLAARTVAGVESLNAGGAGLIAIGTILASTPHILPAAIAEFRRLRPFMTVHLTATTSDRIIELLDREEIEIGVCRLTHESQLARYEFEELFDESYLVFVARDHPLAGRGRIPLSSLVDLPWVIQPAVSPSRRVLEEAFAKAGFSLPIKRLETTSHLATLHLVKHSSMISLLPSAMLADPISEGVFSAIDVGPLKPPSNYGLVTRRGEPQSDPAAQFASILRSLGACPDNDRIRPTKRA
jgi:DNA-binding transcriptional LysR family regulator